MTTVKQLADAVEKIAAMDLNTTPNAMFMFALENALIKRDIFCGHARSIVTRMKVDLCEFDSQNDDWKRVVEGYATIISKLVDQYESEYVVDMAYTLSINYNR